MLVHERHDHLHEITEPPHDEGDLVVIVRLAPLSPLDATAAEDVAQQLDHLPVRRAQRDDEGERRRGAGPHLEAALGDHEATDEVGDVSSRSPRSSGHGTAPVLAPVCHSRRSCRETALHPSSRGSALRTR